MSKTRTASPRTFGPPSSRCSEATLGSQPRFLRSVTENQGCGCFSNLPLASTNIFKDEDFEVLLVVRPSWLRDGFVSHTFTVGARRTRSAGRELGPAFQLHGSQRRAKLVGRPCGCSCKTATFFQPFLNVTSYPPIVFASVFPRSSLNKK